MSITLDYFNDTEFLFPGRFEVCPRCRGSRTHVNPAIDGNGITASEMEELGDDFRDDYVAGVYDVQCQECDGDGLVLVLDEGRCTPEQLAMYDELERERFESNAIEAQEMRMGA